MLPVRLRGEGEPSPLAEEILGPRVDPSVRLILAGLLEGRPPSTSCSSRTSPTRPCGSSPRSACSPATKPPPPLPDFAIVDLLHLPTETTAAYDLDRLRELRALLEGWSGRPLTDETSRTPSSMANRTRKLLAELSELRRANPAGLRGSDALAVLGAGTVLDAASYNALLAAAPRGSAPGAGLGAARLPDRKRPRLDRRLPRRSRPTARSSSARITVRVRRSGTGSSPRPAIRSRRSPPGTTPGRRSPSATTPTPRAERTAADAAAAGADVVLSWIRTGDDALAWGVPALRSALAARGIPLVALEHRELEAPAEAELAALR